MRIFVQTNSIKCFFSTFFIQCNKSSCGKIITTNIEFIIDPKLGLNTSFFIEWLNRVHAEKSGFSQKKRFIVCKVHYLSFYSRDIDFFFFLILLRFLLIIHTQLSLLYFILLSFSIVKVHQ